MADQPVPSSDTTTPPPMPEPLPVEPAQGSSVRRKAIISTAVIAAVAIGIIAYDPFHFFRFDVDVSRDKAAEPSPSSNVRRLIGATCQGGTATVTWEAVADAQVNGLERSQGSGQYIPLFFEGGDAPFKTFTFADTSVKSGTTYHYRLITGNTSRPAPTTTVTCP